jgi:anti-sigma regulatory factor (Ser/Thr protein kinase)
MDTFQTLVVPGTTEGLRAAEQGFDEFSAAHGLTRNDTWPFHVALDEILSNLVKYGSSGHKGPGRIEIVLRLEAEAFEMVILDDAPPFDPLEAARPDTSLGVEERPVGGLGIEIVRRLMDVIEYQRGDDGRNRLTLRRRLGL